MKSRIAAMAILSSAFLLGIAAHDVALAATAESAGAAVGGGLKLHQIDAGAYWEQIGDGNAGFLIGPDGVVVFDTGNSSADGQAIVKAIAQVTAKPIKAIILSHADGDHINGLGAFSPGTEIIAHPATAKAMRAQVAAGKNQFPADRLPTHLVGKSETLKLAGLEIQVLHWAPAHTAGDLVAYVPSEKLVYAGDMFCLDQPRALVHEDPGNAGSSAGWVQSAQATLALDADKFVVGHGGTLGGLQDKKTLQKFVDQSVAERKQVLALLAKGEDPSQIETAVGDPPPGYKSEHYTPFAQVIYDEQKGTKKD